MARRRRSARGALSASAVDLLSCGLAAAAVMWLLVLPNSGHGGAGETKRVNGFVRLSQFGAEHLHGRNAGYPNLASPQSSFSVAFRGKPEQKALIVPPKYEGTYPDWHLVRAAYFDAPSEPTRRSFLAGGSDPGEVILDITPKEGFAAQVSVVFRNVKPRTSVTLRFEPCGTPREPHAIFLTTTDRRAPRKELMFWQYEPNLASALDPIRTNKEDWFPTLAARLAEDPVAFMGTSGRTAWRTRLHTYTGTPRPVPALELRMTAKETGAIEVRAIGTPRALPPTPGTSPLYAKLHDWHLRHLSSGSP